MTQLPPLPTGPAPGARRPSHLDLRDRALRAAGGIFIGYAIDVDNLLAIGDLGDAVLSMAGRFETYIRDGGR